MATSDTVLKDTVLMAIDEINPIGGELAEDYFTLAKTTTWFLP